MIGRIAKSNLLVALDLDATRGNSRLIVVLA